MDNEEKERIKNSFTKVKEDIESLKTQLNEFKSLFEDVIKNAKLAHQKDQFSEKSPQAPKEESSIGNEGVYADIHSFIHSFDRHSTDTKQTFDTQQNQTSNSHKPLISEKNTLSWSLSNLKEIDSLFQTLTKQEFIVFLSIYQMEEDLNKGISYFELSQKMHLSEGCIRTYVSQMLKKVIPIEKIRVNNKLTLLTISKEFRSLNLKQRLFSLFAKNDPNQTTLF